ncbi:hypothetical protein CL653_03320 [bacterium]|nr:hypothetical protein [bacterium]|tara:strand:+ start:692 stop:1168 length:477 start_codon:yes stop_codon:yes gene_type:complete
MKLIYKDWFSIVASDNDKLGDALDYFEQQYLKGQELAQVEGNLMELIKFHAGYLSFYDQLHTQLECLRDLFASDLARIKSTVTREWLDNPPTNVAPNATQVKTLIEGDERVQDLTQALTLINYWYGSYNSLMKNFVQRGFSLSQLTEIRKHGLEEARV